MEILKTIKEVITFIGRPAKDMLDKAEIEFQTTKLRDYLEKVNSIKTIFQPDKQVNVDDIYFPLHVQSGNKKTKVVHSKDLLQYGSTILIEGTAGHGKSLVMRHIAAHEIKYGSQIPIFVQLRKRESGNKLNELLVNELSMLGFSRPERALIYLLRKNRTLILLDGFDEVHSSQRGELVNEIEYLINKFKKPKIIISSRPHLEIRSSYHTTVLKLIDLEKTEQIDFIRHMSTACSSNLLVSAFSENKFIAKVTKTPLLLTLLMIAYQAENRIPDNLIEFYRIIFPTLLYRHDDLKIGYNREKKSTIGKYKLQEIFETFSYLTAAALKVRFNSDFFVNKIKESATISGINVANEADIDNIKHDLVKITCLVIEDGFDNYSYIHKSIQEYFSALYINRLGENTVRKFYDYMLSSYDNLTEWSQVVNFLSELDEPIYNELFAKRILQEHLDSNLKRLTIFGLKKTLNNKSYVTVTDSGELVSITMVQGHLSFISRLIDQSIRDSLSDFLNGISLTIAQFIHDSPIEMYDAMHTSSDINNVIIKELLNSTKMWSQACKHINNQSRNKIHQAVKKINNEINIKAQKERSLLDIINHPNKGK